MSATNLSSLSLDFSSKNMCHDRIMTITYMIQILHYIIYTTNW